MQHKNNINFKKTTLAHPTKTQEQRTKTHQKVEKTET
jgi:hypothetical protein